MVSIDPVLQVDQDFPASCHLEGLVSYYIQNPDQSLYECKNRYAFEITREGKSEYYHGITQCYPRPLITVEDLTLFWRVITSLFHHIVQAPGEVYKSIEEY